MSKSSLLYLSKNDQQFAIRSEVAQKFTQISCRLPLLNKRIKQVFEVYFKTFEFHRARSKKKMGIPN